MQRSERIALHSVCIATRFSRRRSNDNCVYCSGENRVIGSMIIPLLQIPYYILCERNDSDEDYIVFSCNYFLFYQAYLLKYDEKNVEIILH